MQQHRKLPYSNNGRHRAEPVPLDLRPVCTLALAGGLALTGQGVASAAPENAWDKVAQCESSSKWNLNVGTFDGGLQFLPSTWSAYGGSQFAPFAYQASRSEQIVIAERVLKAQGWGAWPVCSRRAGVRDEAAALRAPVPNRPRAAPTAPKHRLEDKPRLTESHSKVPPVSARGKAVAPLTVAPRSSAPDLVKRHLVTAGETLSAIAEQQNVVGGWQALYQYNRVIIDNPNLIYPGERLAVP